MARKPALTVVMGANPLRYASGVRYLAEELSRDGVDVEVVAEVPLEQVHETARWAVPLKSYRAILGGRAPKLSSAAFRAYLVATSIHRPRAFLFVDIAFYREAVAIKRLQRRTLFLHYCAELYTPRDHPENSRVRYFAARANVPDLVIDVEPNRARARREELKLRKEIVVLPNTIPTTALPPRSHTGTLARLAGGAFPDRAPVLCFIGGLHRDIPWGCVIDAVRDAAQRVFLLVFCHGSKQDFEAIERLARERLGPERARIRTAVSREAILACLHEADAGLVYYPYASSPIVSTHYCAPTKVYEYIGVGLPVIGSANPPLRDLIDGRNFGVCAADDTSEGLRRAIDDLFSRPRQERDAIRQQEIRAFREELSWERQCSSGVRRIREVIEEWFQTFR